MNSDGKKRISKFFFKLNSFARFNCLHKALITVKILCNKMRPSLKKWTSKFSCYIRKPCSSENEL